MVKEAVVLGPLVAISTYAQAIFADNGGVEVSGNMVVGLLGNAGIVGTLIWYMWYRTTKSDPAMLKTFSDQLEAQRVSWEKRFEEQRTSSEVKHDKLRETFEGQVNRMREVFEKQLDRLREYSEKERQQSAKESAELRGVMLEMSRNMRIAVHDVKDTANTAILKSSAAEEKARKELKDSKHD